MKCVIFLNLIKVKSYIYEQWQTAVKSLDAYKKIIEIEKPTCVVLHHGFMPQGSALQAAIESGTCCNMVHLVQNSVILAHDTYHRTMPERLCKPLQS